MSIPVIDIFAGPGGLGEGFSSVFDGNRERVFKTVLSIEMEEYAHQTLTLRSFYRQFKQGEAPEEYYEVLRGNLKPEELFKLEKFKEQSEAAITEAKRAKLGYDDDSVDHDLVDEWIIEALKGEENWILTGGPPCQAYSIVGRSRMQRTILDAKEDDRVDLYKQYLRILAMYNPSVFVMENVKGILSARSTESPVFEKVLNDLSDPVKYAEDISDDLKEGLNCPGYKIYSLTKLAEEFDENGNPVFSATDFVIRCEEYGIPQTRHRVILLGIRKDIELIPEVLEKSPKVSISQVIDDLPKLRSGLSKVEDNYNNWSRNIVNITSNGAMTDMDEKVAQEIKKTIKNLKKAQNGVGDKYVKFHGNSSSKPYRDDWFLDKNLNGVSNHTSKSHMGSDLHRYLFSSAYALAHNSSAKLNDFPFSLLPEHKNVNEALKTKKFADRFRVQLKDEPAKTITSHISKDGHYYIHPDPTQCRSLTVREAARIQTFPDNYFFCGSRTSQYIQVGNAVPPLLANQIAEIVEKIFRQLTTAEQNIILNNID